MADSDGDFSDELLELAGASGAPDKKRKKKHLHSSKASKRRKADVDMESEDEQPESEENDNDSTPYPLEGKYIDEADRQRLQQMSEIEREEILAQRLEELQHAQDTRNLDQLVKAQKGGDSDAAKTKPRTNAARGLNKEKNQKLDEYKAKRLAKGDKKQRKTNSPKRDRSSSPMDMETDSEEEEDGQISKLEEQEERERKLYGSKEVVDENIDVKDLAKCQITRDLLAKHYMAPWFEDYVKGAWVRYCIGQDHGESIYRLCEITGLSSAKNYKVNNQMVNQNFALRHGASIKDFPMDRTSNTLFEQREFERLVKSAEHDKVKLPTKKQIEKKVAEMNKLASQPMTENDITAMLARKNLMNDTPKHTAAWVTMEKSRLNQARTLALRRKDYTEMKMIDGQLAELNASNPVAQVREDEKADILAKVNERNRKANLEAVRKAEQMEADRKRRDRKLAAAARANASASPAPSALLAAKNGVSRPATPAVNENGVASALPPSALSHADTVDHSFEASIASIEVDLGDF